MCCCHFDGAIFLARFFCANGLTSFCLTPVGLPYTPTTRESLPQPTESKTLRKSTPPHDSPQQDDPILQKQPAFYWDEHNKLRHFYSTKTPPDLQKAMEHSDIILQHSLMDDYILKILSGWQIDKDNATARSNLLMNTQAFPGMIHITAADLHAAEYNRNEAKAFYREVAEDKTMPGEYRRIVQARLRAR